MELDKECVHCHVLKPLSDFYKCRRYADGIASWCKTCNGAAVKAAKQKQVAKYGAVKRYPGPRWNGSTFTTERTCSRCGLTRAHTEFFVDRADATGLTRWCRNCLTSYRNSASGKQRADEWKAKTLARNYAHVNRVKMERGCSICGEHDLACLDFHHVGGGRKKAWISRLVGRNATLARLDAEIATCVVLCANCHRKHHARKNHPPGGVA